VPLTVARAVLFHDAALAPIGKPLVDVVATAKIELKKGQIIDDLGGYMTYGLCENYDISLHENLLPIGLAEGCILKNDVSKDQVLTYDDVIVPPNRLCDKLRAEQITYFQ
jgi:predicted homoserine dehydrogenase-like protein